MIRLRFVLVALVTLFILPLLLGCEDDLEPVRLPGEVSLQNAYVGAQACRPCHQSEYALFVNSGHAHALKPIVNELPPAYPFAAVPWSPDGTTWDDIQYVIGGYGWKADFVDRDGFLVTGDAAQWHLATQSWAPFAPSAVAKPFDCAPCHTTGYNSSGHQADASGVVGTWRENGVACERCHGAGGAHALSRLSTDIARDRSAAVCGQCHSRGDAAHRIQASDGLIAQYSQYDELLAGSHRVLTCVACHDPHASAHYAAGAGIVLRCRDCHGDIEVYNTGDGAHTCLNCHMPRATKSALSPQQFKGDVRTHLFRIEADREAAQFYTEGGQTFSHGYLTTDYACLACHTGRDRAWAERYAGTIHAADGKARVAGR